MRRKTVTKTVIKLTDGLLEFTTDYTLFVIFLMLESIDKSRYSYSIYRGSLEANSALAKINYQAIKRALYYLKSKKFIEYKYRPNDPKKTLNITHEGFSRLKEIIPTYKTVRTWDGKLYLITYDIPEKTKGSRNLLREFLSKLGAGKLQKSVYVCPYNPRFTLQKFIEDHRLNTAVIVSDLGSDAVIGNESLAQMITRIYQLNKLKDHYSEFIEKYEDMRNDKTEVSFAFLSIVGEDPQLPFELLPKDWPGNKAYKIYRKHLTQKTT